MNMNNPNNDEAYHYLKDNIHQCNVAYDEETMRRRSETTQGIDMIKGRMKEYENKAFSMFPKIVSLMRKWTADTQNILYQNGQAISNYSTVEIGKISIQTISNTNHNHTLINDNMSILLKKDFLVLLS
ncbi:hypothetical protein TRFO_17509 [Tritrichomonas foetus]|uniref:Uncharacterized protein n=1 Tax=Tritrichomonas foetus TaxID=1144522 RepID=A0A1J4KMX2_9EUKA|nr:hypothetical protein TRFO_17509 [Tritrichomonas foetus]|eukprot:OHT12671.1 hypothetical protein TRFO_17509 [Tritrichomonas foetus]